MRWPRRAVVVAALLAPLAAGCTAAPGPDGRASTAGAGNTATGVPASPSGTEASTATPSSSQVAGTPTRSTPAPPYVASATWTTVDGKPRLVVVPTDHARAWISHEHALAVWAEVVTVAPDADTPGMADQFECHLQFVPTKVEYNLEPWRPVVDYRDLVLAACNPGPQASLG